MDAAVAGARGVRVLVAWGDRDTFTGVKKYRRWGEKMGREVGGGFEGVEVEGTGHFWGTEALDEVDEVVERWLV